MIVGDLGIKMMFGVVVEIQRREEKLFDKPASYCSVSRELGVAVVSQLNVLGDVSEVRKRLGDRHQGQDPQNEIVLPMACPPKQSKDERLSESHEKRIDDRALLPALLR